MQSFIKPVISISQQVQQLKDRGLEVPDAELAERYLMSIGYYRLSAYCFPFELNKELHTFREGTSVNDVLSIYTFDRKLRCLFIEAIERIEIHLRAQWVNRLIQTTKDPFAHMDRKNFVEQQKYIKQLSMLLSALAHRQKEPYVAHFYGKYEEVSPPLWSCVQLLSFGELHNWVNNTQDSNLKKEVAKSFGFPDSNPFLSFIVALIEIRNICAHHGRLWNKSLMKKPETIRNLATTNDYITSCLPIVPSGKLFEIVLLMINSLRMINPSTSWPARLGELLLELEDWQLIEMGFPQERETWKQLIV